MKKLFLLTVVVGFLSACSSSFKVTTDYDNTVDFAKLSTYNFTNESINLPINQFNKTRVLNAIEDQMSNKGFTKTDDPQVLINLHVRAEQKVEATANTNYYGGSYRYRYGGGFSTTTVNVNEYVEGTLFIDLIDKSEDLLIWQAICVGTLDLDTKKMAQKIDDTILKAFYKYPPKIK
jgi:hypothetical protein